MGLLKPSTFNVVTAGTGREDLMGWVTIVINIARRIEPLEFFTVFVNFANFFFNYTFFSAPFFFFQHQKISTIFFSTRASFKFFLVIFLDFFW